MVVVNILGKERLQTAWGTAYSYRHQTSVADKLRLSISRRFTAVSAKKPQLRYHNKGSGLYLAACQVIHGEEPQGLVGKYSLLIKHDLYLKQKTLPITSLHSEEGCSNSMC